MAVNKREQAKAEAAAQASTVASTQFNSNTRKSLLDWSEKVGVRQSAVGNTADETLAKVQASKAYWEREATEALPADLLARCRNLHELCAFWAHIGM